MLIYDKLNMRNITMKNTVSKEIYRILSDAKKISTADPHKSYAMSKEAYELSLKNNLKIEEGYAFIGMSFACRSKSENNKMLDYSFKALEIFEEMNDVSGQIKALNLIGIAYFYNSMYERALKYLLQVIELLNNFEDNFLLSCVLNNIGEVYRESDNYDKALEYYHNALEISMNNNFKINEASLFSNIGEIYFLEKRYDKALEYYAKSYDILVEENDMVILGEIENKVGKVHFINGDLSKAEKCFLTSINRLESVNNKFYAIDVLVNIAKISLEEDSEKSFYYFEKAIKYAEEIDAKRKLSEVCKTIAEYYEHANNFKASLEYFKKYCRVNEEIMTSNIGNKLEIIKIEIEHFNDNDKFEKIKNRLEIEILNQRNELEKIKKSNELLEKKVYEDELTGISNRRYINYYLNKTWGKSLLNDEQIVLFIIDIDNFKKYNDYWGHSKGDECLVKVADCMKYIQEKRKDILARYGGEEFVYYARGLNYEQALALGNIIRIEVGKLGLDYIENNMRKEITISVGGATGKASNFNNIPDIIQIADMELYRAKDLGRNITLVKNVNNI